MQYCKNPEKVLQYWNAILQYCNTESLISIGNAPHIYRLKISDGVKVPWADNSRAKLTKSVADMFNDNVQFRNEVLLELIKDCLHMEVAGIVSSTLAVIDTSMDFFFQIEFFWIKPTGMLTLAVCIPTSLYLIHNSKKTLKFFLRCQNKFKMN